MYIMRVTLTHIYSHNHTHTALYTFPRNIGEQVKGDAGKLIRRRFLNGRSSSEASEIAEAAYLHPTKLRLSDA